MLIHRSLITETLRTFAGTTLILLSVFLATRLTGFLRQAADGDIPAASVWLLLLLKTITYLDILAPLALYIATLIVLGRWSREHELTALAACGVGIHRLLRPTLTLALIIGIFTATCSLYLSPLAAHATRATLLTLRANADLTAIPPGTFIHTTDRQRVYFATARDPTTATLHDLFIYDTTAPTPRIVTASTGQHLTDPTTATATLVLRDGHTYRAQAGTATYDTLAFATYRLHLPPPTPRTAAALPLKAMPTRTLLQTHHAAAIGETHWRLAKIVMLPVLMLFALAFSSITPRRQRFPALLAALLLYFTYANTLTLGLALIRRNLAHPHLTLWAIHLLFLALALTLLHRRHHNQPLLPGLPT